MCLDFPTSVTGRPSFKQYFAVSAPRAQRPRKLGMMMKDQWFRPPSEEGVSAYGRGYVWTREKVLGTSTKAVGTNGGKWNIDPGKQDDRAVRCHYAPSCEEGIAFSGRRGARK